MVFTYKYGFTHYVNLIYTVRDYIEIALVWSPNFFTNETLRYIAGIFVVLDVLALLSILLEI